MIRPLPLLALILATPAAADPLADAVRADMPSLVALYREMHASPELSQQEVKSASRLAADAKRLGFEVTTGVGGTGVVAVMRNGAGPTLLIRSDMDALPVTEATGLPYASKVKAISRAGTETGVMHACGHDIHMTSWIATARRLAVMKDRWSGTLVMIGQPAEEVGLGARAMLDDGLYKRFPKPDVALAFHDSADLPAGMIGINPAYAMANVDSVDLVVPGVGTHGAAPQNGKDPVVLAARIVGTLQTLVSREMNPVEPSVVTVGSFHAGTTHNIVPDEARLQITVRSYTPEARKLLLDGIARIAKGEAIAAGMPEDRLPRISVRDEFTPATLNTQPLTGRLQALFAARFGADRVVELKPAMVGEDFSRYRLADEAGVESLLFRVGAVPRAKWDAAKGDATRLPSLHSPLFAPDAEPAIQTATEAMVTAALTLLPKR